MKISIKIAIITLLCCLYIPAGACNKFIVRYKLNEEQKKSLDSYSAGKGKDWIESQAIDRLSQKLSDEQLIELSEAVKNVLQTAEKVTVKDLFPLGTGAHVILLGKDLTDEQAKKFIERVSKSSSIDFIEVDNQVKTLEAQEPNLMYQWDMVGHKEFLAAPW